MKEEKLFIRRISHQALPRGAGVFMVGRGGAYVKQRNVVFDAVVHARELPMLAPIEEQATYLLPPLARDETIRILRFFRVAFEHYKSEAMVLLGWHKQERRFEIIVPSQRVRGGHCQYDWPPQRTDDMIYVGTVHSHGMMPAFHSEEDHDDEQYFHGVHATIGCMDDDYVEIAASLVICGRRLTLAPRHVFGGLRHEKVDERFGVVPHRDIRARRRTRDGYWVLVPRGHEMAEFDPPIAWLAALAPERERVSARRMNTDLLFSRRTVNEWDDLTDPEFAVDMDERVVVEEDGELPEEIVRGVDRRKAP